MTREEERIMKGIMFCPGDPELRAIKLKTHKLDVDYNMTHEDETEKRAAILKEILGEMGEGSFIQGPIAFHFLYSHACDRNPPDQRSVER